MDLTTITVQQFKTQFSRDFPYFSNIQYDSTKIYNMGDEVYYATTNLFYQALVNGVENVTPGSDATKWIVYADEIDNWIQDSDITNAFAEAQVCFNQALFGTDQQITLGYLYMTAHYLCNDIKASRMGVNSQGSFPVTARSVGSVSESYRVPEAYANNPILAMYTTSSYGLKYLAMALPNITGNMAAVWGGAQP